MRKNFRTAFDPREKRWTHRILSERFRCRHDWCMSRLQTDPAVRTNTDSVVTVLVRTAETVCQFLRGR